MAAGEHEGICRAVWYFGKGGERHMNVCHRKPGHRGSHHSDYGLNWTRSAVGRRVRMGDEPCPDCAPLESPGAA